LLKRVINASVVDVRFNCHHIFSGSRMNIREKQRVKKAQQVALLTSKPSAQRQDQRQEVLMERLDSNVVSFDATDTKCADCYTCIDLWSWSHRASAQLFRDGWLHGLRRWAQLYSCIWSDRRKSQQLCGHVDTHCLKASIIVGLRFYERTILTLMRNPFEHPVGLLGYW